MLSSAISFTGLPDDIILYLLRFCSLSVYHAVSMLNTRFHSLAMERVYWIDALRVNHFKEPTVGSSNENLSNHSLLNLKQFAHQTMYLKHNWSRSKPKITGPIKVVMLDQHLDIIFQVPGTEFYVFHSRDNGMISGWDIGLGKKVTQEIYVSRRIVDVSPGHDLPGRFSMGLLTVSTGEIGTVQKLWMLCLEYGLPGLDGGVRLSVPLEYILKPRMYHWAAFIAPEYVGVLRRPLINDIQDDSVVEILALNLSTGQEILISMDFPARILSNSESGTCTIDHELYILVELDNRSLIFKCPTNYLPLNRNSNLPSQMAFKSSEKMSVYEWEEESSDYEFHYSEGVLSSDAFWGVPFVSLHPVTKKRENIIKEHGDEDADSQPESELEETRSAMQIRFWTKNMNPTDSNPHSLIPKRTVIVPGTLQDAPDSHWRLMLLPHSGRMVLLVVLNESGVSLKLVNSNSKEPVKSLQLPSFLNVEDINGLSLDDHRGVITLLTIHNYLFAIPYT